MRLTSASRIPGLCVVLALITTLFAGPPAAQAAGQTPSIQVEVTRTSSAFEVRARVIDAQQAGPVDFVASTTGPQPTEIGRATSDPDLAVTFDRPLSDDGTIIGLRAESGGSVLAQRDVTVTIADTRLRVIAPASVEVGTDFTAQVDLNGPQGALPGRAVAISLGSGQPIEVTTDAAGKGQVTLRSPARGTSTIRADFAGDAGAVAASATTSLTTNPQNLRLSLSAPASIKDGQVATLKILGSTKADATPDAKLSIVINESGLRTRRPYPVTLRDGKASLRVRLWRTARSRANASAQGDLSAARSNLRIISFRPTGKPVPLPGPRPRVRIPAQRLATSSYADVKISTIPNDIWRNMQGRSWRRGCIARSQLRWITVNYWGFDGFRHRGELIVNRSMAGKTKFALELMYKHRLPIRSMYRVDRFGYSSRVRGGDDFKSMAADNTSAFNCRTVVGNPSARSPHSTGRSIDINPWENPYLASFGWTPNSWWVGRTHSRVAWRYPNHLMIRVMNRAGFRWTYGTYDAHHFDG